MPRTERKISETGVYHVLLRGINKQLLFEEAEDYSKFISVLTEVKELSKFKLYAYCLMGNHVHMLLKEGAEPLAKIFKRIGARYVFWFNWKYGRNGHLFQDRFRSEVVESDEYFSAALTYIYLNPVKAGLCNESREYEWSSRKLLSSKNELIDEAELISIVSIKAIEEREQIAHTDELLEPKIGRKQAITDGAAYELMKKLSGVMSAEEFRCTEREMQTKVFSALHEQGVSIRQFARISGLGKGVCERMRSKSRDA